MVALTLAVGSRLGRHSTEFDSTFRAASWRTYGLKLVILRQDLSGNTMDARRLLLEYIADSL